MFNKIRVIGIIIFSAILMTCGGGGGSSAPTEPTEPTYVINIVSLGGAAQKGPFNNGTIINIAELNNSLTPTGKNFTSQIIDNSGTFSVANVQMEFLYAEIRASGFYFDEVGNQVSSAQLVLLGLSNLAGKTNMNVNILSHLELNRIKNLLTGTTPLTFAQAKLQAQEEVLGIFGYSRAGVAESELLDITQAGAGNAKLLAISAILQDQRSVGELSELLANISTDITTDGVLDNTSITQSLLQSAYNLDLETIRTNLEARYAALGLSVTIPDFETEVNNFYKPPTVNDMSTSTDEDTAINITLDGSDPENESLTYSTVEVNNATVTISGNVANYVPTVNWNGTDTFTYMANDGSFNSNTATVTVTVGAIDDDPNTHDISTSTDEDVSVVMNLTADEYDGQNYSFSIIANPSNGTISLSGTTATYTPNQDWNGTDTFTFEATDDRIMFGQRNVATATITVNAINDAPISSEVSGSSDEDTAIDIELSATDVDQDNLTYSVVSDVSNGTTSISGSTLTYTPNQDWNGTDTFTYKVNDGTVDSNTSNGTITIAAVNDAPTTSDISTTIDENRTARMVGITLQGSDVDSDDLTYSVVSDASNGTTSISGATLTYTANQDWNGTETITYKANDGTVDSNTSTVTITVSPVDDSPINNSGSFTAIGDEDTPLEIVIDATDADGDDLNITTSFNASDDGTLTTDGLTITYIPKSNYYSHFDENGNVLGAVALDVSYTVWDGANGTGNNSDNHQIHIYARPVQDIPVSADMNVSVDEDYSGSENIKLNYSDPDSLGYSSGVGTDTVTYSIVSNPSNGSLSLNSSDNPNLTYTPTANYNGTDTFTYKANDGTVDSNTSTVTITVLAFDDAPVVPDSSFVIDEDQVLYIAITATDVDDEDLFTWAVYTDPSNGTAVIQDANSSATASKTYKYTPNSNFFGADSFQYYAANQNSQISNYGKLSFTINSVNDGPTTEDATASTDEDTAVVINIHESTSDIDSTVPSSLSGVEWIIVSQPSNGTLAWVNGGIITNPSSTFENGGGVVTYTPTANWNGTDTFTYKANDGADDGNTATVTITVNAVNDAPVTSDQTASTNEDTAKAITLSATDVEDSSLTYSIVSNPSNGTVSLSGTTATYTPTEDWNSAASSNDSDTFTYKANDGTVDSNTSTVTIAVAAVNDAPIAYNFSQSTDEDNAKTITLRETSPGSNTGTNNEGGVYDPDIETDQDDDITFSLVSQPSNGTATLASGDNDITYTPDANWNGTDTFTYKGNDGSLDSNTATVTVAVTAVNDAPTTNDVSVSTSAGNNVEVEFDYNDIDSTNDLLVLSVVSTPSNGSVSSVFGTGLKYVVYTPNNNWTGTDTFTYKANDGTENNPNLDSNISTATVTVNP